MSNHDQTKGLLQTGTDPRRVGDVIREYIQNNAPFLVWCEPVNGPTPIPGFYGLYAPSESTTPAAVQIAESRLFYKYGMVHLLESGEKTRWAAWWETKESEQIPKWFPKGDEAPDGWTMTVSERPIMLTIEAGTRGLREAKTNCEQVKAFEYYQEGKLRWWRLEPDV